eukprot:Opistho-2@35480
MERIVTSIQGLSTKEDLPQLTTFLSKQAHDIANASVSEINDALSALDPARHALGWVFLLHSKALKRQDPASFVEQAIRLLHEGAREQITIAPDKFVYIAQMLVECVVNTHQAIRAVAPLATAVERFRPSPEHLTPLHCEFLKVCILAKCYRQALRILEIPVTELSPKATSLDPVHVLLYHYYGGIVYCSQKRFKDALYFFQLAITVPAFTTSAVAIEAYKKYILVSLLVNGQVYRKNPCWCVCVCVCVCSWVAIRTESRALCVIRRGLCGWTTDCLYLGVVATCVRFWMQMRSLALVCVAVIFHPTPIIVPTPCKQISLFAVFVCQVGALPKHASTTIVRSLRVYTEAYTELATAFEKRDPQHLRAVAQDRMNTFHEDRNVGLVKQCLESVYNANIERLTQTYLTLSLADIASTVHLRGAAEAESYVLKMIENKQIFAKIDQVAGMVSFHDDPEEYDSIDTIEKIESHVRRAREIFAAMKRKEDQISVSAHYLSKSAQPDRVNPGYEEDLELETKANP